MTPTKEEISVKTVAVKGAVLSFGVNMHEREKRATVRTPFPYTSSSLPFEVSVSRLLFKGAVFFFCLTSSLQERTKGLADSLLDKIIEHSLWWQTKRKKSLKLDSNTAIFRGWILKN